jgi:hypothetical protein
MKTLYFFFAPFFSFFLAALATRLTSEFIIVSNSYLKFAKTSGSRLNQHNAKNKTVTNKKPILTGSNFQKRKQNLSQGNLSKKPETSLEKLLLYQSLQGEKNTMRLNLRERFIFKLEGNIGTVAGQHRPLGCSQKAEPQTDKNLGDKKIWHTNTSLKSGLNRKKPSWSSSCASA